MSVPDRHTLGRVVSAALGLALSQGWFVLVAALCDAYSGGSDIAFVMEPLWFGYAAGACVALLLPSFMRRFGLPHSGCVREGAAVACALVGSMFLIVTHSIISPSSQDSNPVVYAVAFTSCAAIAVGSVSLGRVWVRRLPNDSSDAFGLMATGIVFAAACTCLVPVFGLLRHSIWSPLLFALLVCGSFALLSFDRQRAGSESGGEEGHMEGVGGIGLKRTVLAAGLLAFFISLMIGQFLGAEHGKAPSWVWVFGVAGVACVAIVDAVSFKLLKKWTPYPALCFAGASIVVAFFPINAGTSFSLVFAMAAATFALWATVCSVFPALFFSRDSEVPGSPADLPMLAAHLFCCLGAALGLAVARTDISSTFVFAAAIMSILASIAALSVLVLGGMGVRLQGDGGEGGLGESSVDDDAPVEEAVPDGADFSGMIRQMGADYHLTAREIDVLEVLAQGYDINRVQEALCISEGTALTHKRHIYQKLGVHSRSDLLDLVKRLQG